MNTQLALPKKTFKIYMSSGGSTTVMLSEEPNWVSIIEEKMVVDLDGKTINGSYIAWTEEIDPSEEGADSAMAWAKLQKGGLKAVAIERVRGFESSQGHKMSIEKIMKWMENFIKDGRSEEYTDAYGRFIEIYTQAGGDINNIGPFK